MLFDAEDEAGRKQGLIDAEQAESAVHQLWATEGGDGVSAAQRADMTAWLAGLRERDARLSFPDFVKGVSDVMHREVGRRGRRRKGFQTIAESVWPAVVVELLTDREEATATHACLSRSCCSSRSSRPAMAVGGRRAAPRHPARSALSARRARARS